MIWQFRNKPDTVNTFMITLKNVKIENLDLMSVVCCFNNNVYCI